MWTLLLLVWCTQQSNVTRFTSSSSGTESEGRERRDRVTSVTRSCDLFRKVLFSLLLLLPQRITQCSLLTSKHYPIDRLVLPLHHCLCVHLHVYVCMCVFGCAFPINTWSDQRNDSQRKMPVSWLWLCRFRAESWISDEEIRAGKAGLKSGHKVRFLMIVQPEIIPFFLLSI